MTTVFVSGFTGYIALHIVKQLLEKGYTVIGSGRTEAKSEKYAKTINNSNFSYVAVAQLSDDGAFDKVFQDHPEIELVFHVASPVTFNPEDPERDVLLPAIKGTTGIMESISKYGKNVKRLVITSSYSAHNSPDDHYGHPTRVVTEDMISTLTYERAKTVPSTTYWGSKKFADRASWEYMEEHKPHFELSTVSPLWCYGPQAYDEFAKDPVSTLAILKSYIDHKETDGAFQFDEGSFSDVRDIARLQIFAAESEKAAGQRLLLSGGKFDASTILAVVRKYYPEVPVVKIEPHTQAEINCPYVDCSKTLELSGIKLTPFEVSVKETLDQMKRVGLF